MARAKKTSKKSASGAKSGSAKKETRIDDAVPGTEDAISETVSGAVGSVAPGAGASNPAQGKTIANMLGEMVWLLTTSQTHKHFSLSDLEWMIMPPLMLEQYRIYYDGQRPIALALWAYLSDDAEKKLESGGTRLRPDEWRSDGAEATKTILERRQSGGAGTLPEDIRHPAGRLWLVDLIAPQATPENKMTEKIIADLAQNVFPGRKLKFHVTNPQTGKREVKEVST